MHLNSKQLELVQSSDIIYLKRSALAAVNLGLIGLQSALVEVCNNHPILKEFDTFNQPKISKGENYKKLPYVVLDFPATFSRSSIFAFRSMFWWGHFFSFTLHIQGEALDLLREKIMQHKKEILSSGFYLGVNSTPWEYHYESENYKALSDFKMQEFIDTVNNKNFFKIIHKILIAEYERLVDNGCDAFQKMLGFLN